MESTYCNNNGGDYRNTPESNPEQIFSDQEIETNVNSNYCLNENLSLKNNHFENKNSSNTSFQSNTSHVLLDKNKEFLLKSKNKSENTECQQFDNGNAMSLYAARRDNNVLKDKITKKTEPKVETNRAVRPNRESLGSVSAPSILSFAPKQHLSGDGRDGHERSKRDFKNEKNLTEHPAIILRKIPEKFQLSRRERNQKMKSSHRSKIVVIKKRQDSRKFLKIPTKRIYLTANGKIHSDEKSSFDSVEMKYIPGRINSDETDRCSSYSESDLRYITEQGNQIYERNRLYPNFQQRLRQSSQRNSVNDSLKYISNALRYSNHRVPCEDSPNKNHPKKSDSRFTTDIFLQKELSDFKEFLIHRRNQQKQRTNRGPKIRTICLPESSKLQEMIELQNRMTKNDYKKGKKQVDERERKAHPYLQTVHKIRRPKVSDDELWKRYENNFRRYASTKRYSGEVIPRKISTEWMSNMGVVGDLLTERDADNEFKKAAGSKITMNMKEYKEFLITLTIKKKLPFYEIYRRMCGI